MIKVMFLLCCAFQLITAAPVTYEFYDEGYVVELDVDDTEDDSQFDPQPEVISISKREVKEIPEGTPVEIRITKHSVSKEKKPVREADGTIDEEEDETDSDVKIVVQGIVSSEETAQQGASHFASKSSGILDFLSPIVFGSHPELGSVTPLISTSDGTEDKNSSEGYILEEIIIDLPSTTTEAVKTSSLLSSTVKSHRKDAETSHTSSATSTRATVTTHSQDTKGVTETKEKNQ